MALDQATIEALLKGELNKPHSLPTPTGGIDRSKWQPRPVQLGPLRWSETTRPCQFTTGIGCGSPTRIRINDVPICGSHALYELNKMILELQDVDLTKCTCEPGKYSLGNIHLAHCEIVPDDNELL